jgi:hypothetical protein
MVTDTPASRTDAGLTDGGGEMAESSEGVATHRRAPRWTPAHTETARFLGECVGAGAVLGMVAAMSRAPRGE